MTAIVERCLAWCDGPRVTHIVVTANASHLCMMRRDAALREACQAADMAVADGMSVVWALRALGRPVPERVAGHRPDDGAARGRQHRRPAGVLSGRHDRTSLDALVAHCAPTLSRTGRRGLAKRILHEPAITLSIVEEMRASRAGHAVRRHAEPVQGRLLPAPSGSPPGAGDRRRRRQLRRAGRIHQARAEEPCSGTGSSGRGGS